MEKISFFLLFLLKFLPHHNFASIHLQNDHVKNDGHCSVQINSQNDQRSFIQNLISHHLPHCYIVQIHNDDYEFQFDQQFSIKMPTMNVNLLNTKSQTMFQYYNTKERRSMIRHQAQCIVHYLIFSPDKPLAQQHDQFGTISTDDIQMKRLGKIFLHPPFQSQAHQSYIFLHNQNDYRMDMETLILHPFLKNYEHKTWIKLNSTPHHRRHNDEGCQPSKLTVTIQSFCYFCHSGQPGLIKIQASKKIPQNLEQIFPDVTSNLNGRSLRVTAAMALPFVGILSSSSSKKQLRIEGMQATILKALASSMNFTYILENTSGGLTGSKSFNGVWTGTIGEVLYHRSDIGLNAATSSDRHEIVDFTVSAFYGFLVLVSTKPSPVFEWKAIFYPFEIRAWLFICLTTILTVLAYKFFLNYAVRPEDKETRRGRGGTGSSRNIVSSTTITTTSTTGPSSRKWKEVPFGQVCHFTIGTLLEQGVPLNYFSTPSRVYSLFWLLVFTGVVACAYKSKLFAYLTCPTVHIPPSTFYELAISSYSIIYKSLGGVGYQFIKKSPVSYIRSVGERMEISMDKYSCMDKTFSEEFVCIIYRAYYDYMSAVRYWKISHKFHVSDYVTPPVGSSWVLPKYSPLLYPLDKNIFLQFEMGLAGIYLEHYIKEMALKSRAVAQASNDTKDLFDMNTKFQRHNVQEKPLEFANLYAGFLALFFGSGISLIVFIVEHWRHKNKNIKIISSANNVVVQNWERVRRLYGLHLMRPKQRGRRRRKRV